MPESAQTPLDFLIQCVREHYEKDEAKRIAAAVAEERKRIHEAIIERARASTQHNYYLCIAVQLFPEFSK
jgi:hypothetical protein